MTQVKHQMSVDVDPEETKEWVESINALLVGGDKDRAVFLLHKLMEHVQVAGVPIPFNANTPYINTIPVEEEPIYPGNRAIERKIKSLMRWNAMAMVVRANRKPGAVGGHIATYQSIANIYEIGFNHFFHAKTESHPGDSVFFQGHSSPGIYSRAFMEGRLSEEQLDNFRREFGDGGGLSSYPHPRLMPEFWQFPTVSMGLGPINAIYQARINRYLQNRNILDTSKAKIYCFIGDGEMDEPETTACIRLAARENLDNLIFVVNCNLQRLDGPVRGNGKVIQEFEGLFRGAGWDVIKVVWGSNWDALLKADVDGNLVKVMEETVDGEYQKYSLSDGKYIREEFFNKIPGLEKVVEKLTDKEIEKLARGGHDPQKVYAAFHKAQEMDGRPKVLLIKTVKGYGLGEAGEAKNVAHNQKKLTEDQLIAFVHRFNLPIPEDKIADAPYYRPPEDSAEMQYIRQHREALGGSLPKRSEKYKKVTLPPEKMYEVLYKGSGEREQSTTFGFNRIISALMKDKEFGKYIVPIIPDEARTFGMEGLFGQVGIYSPTGQLYDPVDKGKGLAYYKEEKNGQIFEEGLNEAGAMACFIGAGTSYSTHGIPLVPMYIYYSMFGFQRIGDLVWCAMDQKAKGFMIGGTSGRTTLNGEGLQHQDGQSQLFASTVPSLVSYDPAFTYELAVIVKDGLKRMYGEGEDLFYYISVYNDDIVQPAKPAEKDIDEKICKGLYKFKASKKPKGKTKKNPKAHLFSSGTLFNESLKAAEILEKDYKISTDVWSVTSYKSLRTDALRVERWNLLNPDEKPKKSFLEESLEGETGSFVASSDNMRMVSEQISKWVPGGLFSLGTDGHGLSDTREVLRDYFEVNHKYQIIATVAQLVKQGEVKKDLLSKVIKDLGVLSNKRNPLYKI
ncbi:MAG: pyruvate dehydrogenase (acetyl-transferring), homodimeric type [Planctomycetota bacterium]|nr:MAG: pyruvate dehydrogenase (acetyl-transferring), homodimeric type [Planctomycetota bacterium]